MPIIGIGTLTRQSLLLPSDNQLWIRSRCEYGVPDASRNKLVGISLALAYDVISPSFILQTCAFSSFSSLTIHHFIYKW